MNFNELLMSLEIGLIYGIVAIGIYYTFRIIDFPDLTCDGSFVLGMAVSSVLIKGGVSPAISLFIATIAGGLSGCVTGILNVYFKVTELLSGILVAFMLYSINLKVMGGLPNIAIITEKTLFSGSNTVALLALICAVVWGVTSYILVTDWGLALRSIGQNRWLAIMNGISVQNMTIIGLIISNALIGLSGGLFSQYQGFADIGAGAGTIIIALAAVMIGEKVFVFRSPFITIFGCIIGSVIYRLVISFALHGEIFGLETQDLNLVTGLMVIGIMNLRKRKIC